VSIATTLLFFNDILVPGGYVDDSAVTLEKHVAAGFHRLHFDNILHDEPIGYVMQGEGEGPAPRFPLIVDLTEEVVL
jgi:hypothetical protein